MVAMNVWPTDAADGAVTSEARWRKMARYWAPTGVCIGQGGDMVPTLAYPNLTVRSGAAWVDGHYCELPGDQVLAVTPSGLAVVRFDPAANTAQLLYLDGASVPSQSPTGVYELPIAKMAGSAMTDQRAAAALGNLPSQYVHLDGSGSVTAGNPTKGQVPGLAYTITAKPYPRTVIAYCQLGLAWSSGGANTYWIGQFLWNGLIQGMLTANQFFFARNPTSIGNGVSIGTIAPNTQANLTMYAGADVTASGTVSSSWVDLLITPSGPLT